MPVQHVLDLRERVAEELVLLYLRLNGYLVLGNYLLHRGLHEGPGLRTEVDTLAARCPYQREPLLGGRASEQVNDSRFVLPRTAAQIDFVVAEVKTGKKPPNFNPSLIKDSDQAKQNLVDLLEMLGPFSDRAEIETAKVELHKKLRDTKTSCPPSYVLKDGCAQVRFVLFWEPPAEVHVKARPFVPLGDVLSFVERRTRPGSACAEYPRWQAKWKGLTRRILDAIDEKRAEGGVHRNLEDLAAHILTRWGSEAPGVPVKAIF